MTPKIAIIGAGPGGCMLARLLHQHSIPCIIFEGEKSIDYRSQGGTLDLRAGTGLAAIKEAGLWDEFQKHARYDGESLLICDKNLTTWFRRAPSKQGEKNLLHQAPEIDRVVLRQMLMESVDADIVRWGYRLVRVDKDLSSLHFENGSVETGFDLIVGADGAFSKTRNLLSSEKPFYSGLAGPAMSIPSHVEIPPEVRNIINRGSVFSFSDSKSLTGQQIGDGSIMVAYHTHYDEDYPSKCGFDVTDVKAVRRALKKELQDWSPKLTLMLDYVEGPVQWRNYYMLPVGFQWEHTKGITLLGDAAHLMTPFAGIGVNLAFYDAMLLTRAIVDCTKSGDLSNLDEYIITYEKKMLASAKQGQEMTEGAMNDMMFTHGAPRTSIESYILRVAKPEFSRWAHPLLTAIIYTGYFIYKLFV